MKRCERMQIRRCKTKISKVKAENKREDFPRGYDNSKILQAKELWRWGDWKEGKSNPWVTQAGKVQGRVNCPDVCKSKVAGVILKVGTSNTGIVCEPSFIFFVMDWSFCFLIFTSPFLSIALRISGGLYLLCFYVKMNKETKREIIFISHCILTGKWGRYGVGTSSPLSWFSLQSKRTLLRLCLEV